MKNRGGSTSTTSSEAVTQPAVAKPQPATPAAAELTAEEKQARQRASVGATAGSESRLGDYGTSIMRG